MSLLFLMLLRLRMLLMAVRLLLLLLLLPFLVRTHHSPCWLLPFLVRTHHNPCWFLLPPTVCSSKARKKHVIVRHYIFTVPPAGSRCMYGAPIFCGIRVFLTFPCFASVFSSGRIVYYAYGLPAWLTVVAVVENFQVSSPSQIICHSTQQ